MLDDLAAPVIAALRNAGAKFAYVHGSHASGTATVDADLDVAAWFGVESPPLPWTVEGLPPTVDLLVLDGAPLELAGRVAMTGQLLFDDDPPDRVRWEAMTRKMWSDEAPRVARARQDFIEAFRG